MATLDLDTWWPDLFEGMDDAAKVSIKDTFAASWHEGWQPNREDVSDLIGYHRGTLSFDEYMARAKARALRQRAGA